MVFRLNGMGVPSCSVNFYQKSQASVNQRIPIGHVIFIRVSFPISAMNDMHLLFRRKANQQKVDFFDRNHRFVEQSEYANCAEINALPIHSAPYHFGIILKS